MNTMKNKISYDTLFTEVLLFKGVSKEEVRSRSRRKEVTEAKHMFRFLCFDMKDSIDEEMNLRKVADFTKGVYAVSKPNVLFSKYTYEGWLGFLPSIKKDYSMFNSLMAEKYKL